MRFLRRLVRVARIDWVNGALRSVVVRGDTLRSAYEIRVPRVLAQIVDHEAAAGDHLVSVGADQRQRALDQFGGDAAAAQRGWRLGVGDDDRLRGQPVVGESLTAFDIELA